MTGVVKMSLDEYLELVQRQTRAETQLSTFCDMLLERAWMAKGSREIHFDEEYICQMLENFGYDVKGRVEELRKEYDDELAPVTIPEGVDDDLPFA